jgi:hypothetical protein
MFIKYNYQVNNNFTKSIVLILVIGLFTIFKFECGSAQSQDDWSPQQRIPGYEDDTLPPILIADQARTVHAFTSQWIGETNQKKAIVYNQWTANRGWTEPVDILLSPLKNEARLLGAFLDSTGMVHIIFFGGDNTQANIYYAKAPASSVDNASAWSTPVVVGKDALDPESGALQGDDKGNLTILFGGKNNGIGLYAVYSEDNGESWSEPKRVFLTNNNLLFPQDVNMYLGPSGVLHAVWSVYDATGNGVAAYYANYDMVRKQWSNPLELVSRASGLSNVIEYNDQAVVVYVDYGTNAFWMLKSSDNGRTWTNPTRIAPRHIGRNGSVSLTIDNNNDLHLFFGERIPGNPTIHGMWHSILQGSQWSEPEPVVSGPAINDPVGKKSFDPYNARAVISQGNVLLVTWQSDPGPQNRPNGVWYSAKILDAQELPIIAPQTVSLTPDEIFLVTSTPTLIPEIDKKEIPISETSFQSVGSTDTKSPGNGLLVGSVVTAVFIIAALSWRFFTIRQSH